MAGNPEIDRKRHSKSSKTVALDPLIEQSSEGKKGKRKRVKNEGHSATTSDVTSSLVKSEKHMKKKNRDEAACKGAIDNVTPISSDGRHEKKRKREAHKASVSDTRNGESSEKKNHKKIEHAGGASAVSSENEGKMRKRDRAESHSAQSHSPSQSAGEPAISDVEVSEYLSGHGISIDCGFSASAAPLPNDLKPIISFSSLLSRLPKPLHNAVGSFERPTPIQACSWPAILEGRDVVGIAETGSGKTLAFGIPAVSKIAKVGRGISSKKPKAKHGEKTQISVLVLAPTRELALQTHETLAELGKPFGFTSVALYGGVDKEPQRRALSEEGAAMIVGTPGRILDLLNEQSCDLSEVTYLVLDEADRMLDKGFENDIRTIIGHCSASDERQTLMFSATWPDAVRRLASTFQRDPVRVTVGSDDLTANRRVEQVVEVFDDQREKDSRLTSHLRVLRARKGGKGSQDEARILVFVLYKKEAARVEQSLRSQGFSVGGIHGDLSQFARMAALDDFKTGKTQLLVATDVAARGLDIPNVGTVINYSFPLTVEDYVHRIGRTGRGGRNGKSVTFFTGDKHERALAGELAKVMRESGFDAGPLKRFPMTIKKKEHSVYGAFYRDDIPSDVVPTRMRF